MPTVKEDIEFGCRNIGLSEEIIVSNLDPGMEMILMIYMAEMQTQVVMDD